MQDFDFTLVLCTLGRTREVAAFLEALKQDTPADISIQLLVVDQNDEDILSPILKDYASCWTLEHIRTEVRGISPARNLVLERVAGRYVAFPDDDCIYLDGTLAKVKHYFESHDGADALMGVWSDILAPDFRVPGLEKKVNAFSLFKRGEAFVQFYRQHVVKRVGQFDPDFGPGPHSKYPFGGDDSDYLLRAALAGFSIWRVSEIHVAHPMQNVSGFPWRKVSGYGFTRMKLLAKHRMPAWFVLGNLLYPLLQILRHPTCAKYFFAMFSGRLRGLLA